MAFGTDGDQALIEAFAHNFPLAYQLRCFIHMRRNLESKLKENGLPSSVAQEFISDVFGKHIGGTYESGLLPTLILVLKTVKIFGVSEKNPMSDLAKLHFLIILCSIVLIFFATLCSVMSDRKLVWALLHKVLLPMPVKV